MKFLTPWLLLVCLSPLQVQAQSVLSGSSITLFPPTNAHHPTSQKAERAAVQALLQIAPQIGNDAQSRRCVAVALARLGATDSALVVARDKVAQNAVRQMSALRSVFTGTTENARHRISQLPASSRPYLQLELARRFLLEKQPEKAIEVLRLIPLPNSAASETVQSQGDIALAFAEAGNKVEAQKRFVLLDGLLIKLAVRDKESKQEAESEWGALTFFHLLAGLPLPAHQLIARGRFSIIYALNFYLEANQEEPIRKILELLPPEQGLEILANVMPVEDGKKINEVRQKITRELLAKTPMEKRTAFVEREARALASWGDAKAGLKLIEEFLSSTARRQAEHQLRLAALSNPRSAAKIPPEIRRSWATQLLRELQIQRRQQLRETENTNVLYGTLMEIFEVALVLGQNQTAQNALYEREKLFVDDLESNQFGSEEDEQITAELFVLDWSRAGNAKRAAEWRQKAQGMNTKNGQGALSRVRELLRRQRMQEVAQFLPRVSKTEWKQVGDEELESIVASASPEPVGTAQKEPPTWITNLATPAQKAKVLSEWASFLAPWEIMRWARVGEKMS
ncbi:hypothetical protein IAD21_02738 [Abditibacteriota bacterium]|nr:hypothetical protein IAD21_02738 [Abditibacteriota bacterium]